jgi:lysophospholipase L1-like esterase
VFALQLCVLASDGDITAEKLHAAKQRVGGFKFRFVIKPKPGFKHLPPPPPPPQRPPSSQLYVPPRVASLYPNDRIAIAGDSVTYLGFQSGGWVDLWQQYVQAYYPSMNLQFYNYGVGGYRSADLLNSFPTVLQNNPTVVLIFIGVNDGGYGVSYLPRQQSNIQIMIDECRACPSVRSIILISPFCWGEQHDGENMFDSVLDPMVQAQAAVAAANGCPFINLRALWSSAEYLYNNSDASSGILTEGPPGVHPNALGAQLISGAMIKSFGE